MDLGRTLAKDAAKKGICKPWHDELRNFGNDIDKILEMYLKGIDFCLESDFPDKDFIAKHFKGKMETSGVFLDDAIDIWDAKKVVALGTTSGNVHTTRYGVSEVFVTHDADLDILPKENSFVVVDVWGNATVRVRSYHRARVCVNIYSSNAKVEYSQNDESLVKVRYKYNKN